MANTGQRRHRRYEVQDVHGALLFRTQVKVRNLSVSGLALETPERLQLGRTYAIRLAGDHDAVDVSGTIRWCRLASARPAAGGEPRAVYEAGLAFEGVFSEMAKGLLGFLEHHVVLSPHQRLTGRFRAEALRPAELEARYGFEVLKLSLSGMLVRTTLEASLGDTFEVELALRDGIVPLHGRVAYFQRDDAVKGEVATQLGLEFVDVSESARSALAKFIASELEHGPGDAARAGGAPQPPRIDPAAGARGNRRAPAVRGGSMRIATWNVNSVKARKERLLAFLARHRPDVVCLQELKTEEKGYPFEELRAAGYESAVLGQKTYNGVAILSREAPADVDDRLRGRRRREPGAPRGGDGGRLA